MKKLILMLFFVTSFLVTGLLANDVKEDNFSSKKMMKECKITVTDNQTGKSYTLQVEGQTCDELFSSILSALMR